MVLFFYIINVINFLLLRKTLHYIRLILFFDNRLKINKML